MLELQYNYTIDGECGSVSAAFLKHGVNHFSEALEWTHQLPYGRNSDRADYMLIFREGCGTCSTKHAALAALCRENGVNVQLQMAICRLDIVLEPNVASFLKVLGTDFFPEAHCFLQLDDHEVDVTFPNQCPILKVEVLQAYSIEPEQIGDYKETLHREFLREWLQGRELSFSEVWKLRERWIESLRGTVDT